MRLLMHPSWGTTAMRRREFIKLAGGAAAIWPALGALAQQTIPGIGFLGSHAATQAAGGIIPADRTFPWNPGLMSKGGVPNRTVVYKTLMPLGGNANDSAQIQAAVTSCPVNQVVMLGPGTFIVNNYVLIRKSITLRGSGAGVTILKKTNGATGRTSTVVAGTIASGEPLNNHIYAPNIQNPSDAHPIIIVGQARWPKPDSTTSQNLTANGVQGSYSIDIANAANFAAGQWILLDEISRWSYVTVPPGYNPNGIQVKAGDHVVFQMHNPAQPWDDGPQGFGWFSRGYPSNTSSKSDTDGRMTNEIKEIASVNGNTITFTTPLSIDYRVSHLAQLTRYVAGSNGGNGGTQVVNAGVEDLTMIGGSDGSLRFEVTAYCWAKNVEVTQWLGEGIAINNSFRTEICDSHIHTGSAPTPGGGGYAISLAAGSSEILIENNISRDTNKVMVARSSGTGSVVAYNYMDDGWISYSPTWQEIGLNASHMAGPHHVLFEGNYIFPLIPSSFSRLAALRPIASPCRNAVSATTMVGTTKAPAATIICAVCVSRSEPCSMLRTPAAMHACAESDVWQCAIT